MPPHTTRAAPHTHAEIILLSEPRPAALQRGFLLEIVFTRTEMNEFALEPAKQARHDGAERKHPIPFLDGRNERKGEEDESEDVKNVV